MSHYVDIVPDDPLSMDPRTREDFETLSAALADLVISKHGNKPLYAAFVEHHVKALCAPLRDLETRKASSALATMANEKQRAAKDAQGGKKKTKAAAKPALAKQTTKVDTSAYHEALDDEFDDFVCYHVTTSFSYFHCIIFLPTDSSGSLHRCSVIFLHHHTLPCRLSSLPAFAIELFLLVCGNKLSMSIWYTYALHRLGKLNLVVSSLP
jgi:hypothetical protein